MSYQPPMISNPEGEGFPPQEQQNYNQPPIQPATYNPEYFQQMQQNYDNYQGQEQRADIPYHEHTGHDDAAAQQQQQQERLLEPAKEVQQLTEQEHGHDQNYYKYRQPKGTMATHKLKQNKKDRIGEKAEGALLCCACCVAGCECCAALLECISCLATCCK